MSQWTHVAGIIRIDNLDNMIIAAPDTRQTIVECLSPGLPAGSEGPLLFRALEDPGRLQYNSIHWGEIAIWGDLRDYEEAQPIVDWFREALCRLQAAHQMIRDAVMVIDVPFKEQRIVRPIVRGDEPNTALTEFELPPYEPKAQR